MTQPIAEGESIILLDPEDNKEFLYRLRAKGISSSILAGTQEKEENKEKFLKHYGRFWNENLGRDQRDS